MSHAIPETRLGRASIAGATALKIGAGELKHRIKRPFLSKAAQISDKQSQDEKNARILFNALTQLRGTALKVAQALGMESNLLPKAYTIELKKSFHQVPPLNRVLIRKVIQNELQQTHEQLFGSFDTQSFAAASLGQVHHATLPDHTKVAVKVQYPGIDKAIASDMALMRTLTSHMGQQQIISKSLDEVEARLTEEVDYRIEASNTQWFKNNLKLKGVKIPKVYPQWCSQRVITTEYLSGLHLNDWLATSPSQALRNEVGQKLYDFFLYSTETLRCLHADPNPGNYLIQEDGTLAVIDFGCVRRFSKKFVNAFPVLLKAYKDDDPETLFAAYRQINMSYDHEDKVYKEVLRPFGRWITRPYLNDTFDFGKHNDYSQQGREFINQIQKNTVVNNFSEEFVFHNRTVFGMFQMFEKLQAVVKIRRDDLL